MSAELILIRHGETLGESSIRLNGVTDVGLSPLGARQMARVRDSLVDVSVDRVLTSPLLRARQSNRIVRPEREALVVAGFREIDFGHWETCTWAEVAERDPDGYQRFRAARDDFQFPGGDSRYGFASRVTEATREHLQNATGSTIAVLHKGVIKTALGVLLGLSTAETRAQPCELGSIHRVRRHDGRWTLVSRNLTDHLGSDRSEGSH